MTSILIEFENETCRIHHAFFEKAVPLYFTDYAAMEALLSALASFIKSHDMTISIPAEKTILRELVLDATLTEADILAYLESESLTLFGHAAQRLSIDYCVEKNEAPKTQKIIAYATHAEIISMLLSTFKQYHFTITDIRITHCKHNINFLPWRATQKRKQAYRHSVITACLSLCCVIFFIGIKFFLTAKITALSDQNQKLTHQIALIHTNLAKQDMRLLHTITLLSREKIASEKANGALITLMQKIADTLPPNTILTSLIIESPKIMLSGESNQITNIHQYQLNLHNALSNQRIKIDAINADKTKPTVVRFEIGISK